MIIVILFLIIGIISLIVLYSITRKKNKNYEKQFDDIEKQFDDIKDDAETWKNNYETEHRLYTDLTDNICEQKAHTQEVTSRRRVTQTMKKNVLIRDNRTCQICGISYDFLENLCTGLGDYLLLEIDHIQSVANGGTGKQEDNLQCLCWRCNRTKGKNKTNEDVKSSIDYGIDKLIPKIETNENYMIE
jgi:hypothetical protein